MAFKQKFVLCTSLILLGLGSLLISQSLSIGRLRLIACDVGQGDAQLLITPEGQQMLIDGGPNNKVIDCLAHHMPFWDRKVEVVVNTHPQQDHLQGLPQVLKDYEVGLVVRTPVANATKLYETWQNQLKSANVKTYSPVKGDILKLGSIKIEVLWPDKASLDRWKLRPPTDLNESSIVMRVNASSGSGCVYLTGDINIDILERIVDRSCEVLKVAHHGSKTGTSRLVLNKIMPKIALIQVGLKNRYHHPRQEVLDFLAANGVQVLRNDLNGEVEVESLPVGGGKGWSVKSER